MWGESWHLDFWNGMAGFVRLGLYPHLGVAWWWTYLLTPERLVVVRDHEVPLPRVGLEVRAEGLWAELVCETPLEHWSIRLEAFGVALDDPLEAWREEWGERVPVGLDLEWELLAPPTEAPGAGPPHAQGGDYVQPGRVHGELLVGAERIAFEGLGLRAHRWGRSDWWTGGGSPGVHRHWVGLQGAGAGVTSFAIPSEDARSVEVLQAGFDDRYLPLGATYTLDGQPVEIAVLGVAPVLLTGPEGRRARLARALCRGETSDGIATGWAEWLLDG